MTRKAASLAVALALAPSSVAVADHPGDPSAPISGLDHARQDARILKAQAKARERWRKMTRVERQDARRRDRRATHRVYAAARAAAGAPHKVGSWAPPFRMGKGYKRYAVHAAMLHTGKVLMWGPQNRLLGSAATHAYLWDPTKGYGLDAVRDMTPTHEDGTNIPLYCSGMSFLADGRLLVVGGTFRAPMDDPNDEYTDFAGLNEAFIFDPDTETWSEVPRPPGSEGRWYPSQVLLADGRTLVVSGYTEDPPGTVLNTTLDLYDPETNTFTLLDSAEQRREIPALYPHLFTMPDGTILMAGQDDTDSAIFDPANLPSPWTDLPPLTQERIGGTAVLLPEGPAGSSAVAAIGGAMPRGVPTASAEMIDLDDAAPTWSSFPGLHVARWWQNTVLLPDRSMITIGGEDLDDSTQVPERALELYNPATGRWRVGPSQVETREYHSTAVLMPDGRVLSTGDDLYPGDGTHPGASPDDTGEIYSPPYLFKGSRPRISWARDAVPWDMPFAISTTRDVDDAVLMAPSAVTHSTDMTQRLIPLAIVARRPGGVTLQSPPSAEVAPPGWYMLFVLDDGVPSVAEWVRLDNTATDRTGPRLRVKYPHYRWLRRLRNRGYVRVRLKVNEPATVDLRLLRHGRRVGHEARKMEAGRRTVRLGLRERALQWLRRTDAPRLRLVALAVDAAGDETARSRRLRP